MEESKTGNHVSNLIQARNSLKLVLEKSRILSSSIDSTGQKLDQTSLRLPYLEAAVRPIRAQKEALISVGGHINRAVSPASAVLKVFDAVHGLEKSLLSDPQNDLSGYFSVLKRLQEAVVFLGENCGLAIQWLQDIVEYLEDNLVADNRFISTLNKSLAQLKDPDMAEDRDNLGGGLLEAALEKLDFEFHRLLSENTVPLPMPGSPPPQSPPGRSPISSSPLPITVIQKLQAILARTATGRRPEKCASSFIQVRGTNLRSSLRRLGLDYLDPSDSDDAHRMDADISRWRGHLEFAVRHLLEPEHALCNEVFERAGARVWAEIASTSGILEFLGFGMRVTESRKDPIKLLKLLEVFESLGSLRGDFNRLFGGPSCSAVQDLTRDLVRRVVEGACEIFRELLPQVELQRASPPPRDAGVPKLVAFITDYGNRLLGEEHGRALAQVLAIQRSWRHETVEDERVLVDTVLEMVKAVEANMEAWAKAYEDGTKSHFFLMNNHWHMYRGLRGTKVGRVLGEGWLEEHDQCREFYMRSYMRESWGRLPAQLSREGLLTWSGGRATARDLVKRRLRQFNEALEGMLGRQEGWVVVDRDLREKTCRKIVQVVVPVYRSYMQNYGALVEEQGGKYMKYTVEELEGLLASLFVPKPGLFRPGSLPGKPKSGDGRPAPPVSSATRTA